MLYLSRISDASNFLTNKTARHDDGNQLTHSFFLVCRSVITDQCIVTVCQTKHLKRTALSDNNVYFLACTVNVFRWLLNSWYTKEFGCQQASRFCKNVYSISKEKHPMHTFFITSRMGVHFYCFSIWPVLECLSKK